MNYRTVDYNKLQSSDRTTKSICIAWIRPNLLTLSLLHFHNVVTSFTLIAIGIVFNDM